MLFLKNDLEALARSSAAPASVFGRQRLAAGIGAFASGVVGGQLYGAAESAGSARAFWAAVCLQCLLLPVFLLHAAPGPGPRGIPGGRRLRAVPQFPVDQADAGSGPRCASAGSVLHCPASSRRARATRERTVPIGQPAAAAASS